MSLSAYEKFRYTSLSAKENEEALMKLHDLEHVIVDVGSDMLGDAKTAIIHEDCLQEQINSLLQIIQDMGTSKFKKPLLEFVEELQDRQQELGQQGEHAAEELKAVENRWNSVYNLI